MLPLVSVCDKRLLLERSIKPLVRATFSTCNANSWAWGLTGDQSIVTTVNITSWHDILLKRITLWSTSICFIQGQGWCKHDRWMTIQTYSKMLFKTGHWHSPSFFILISSVTSTCRRCASINHAFTCITSLMMQISQCDNKTLPHLSEHKSYSEMSQPVECVEETDCWNAKLDHNEKYAHLILTDILPTRLGVSHSHTVFTGWVFNLASLVCPIGNLLQMSPTSSTSLGHIFWSCPGLTLFWRGVFDSLSLCHCSTSANIYPSPLTPFRVLPIGHSIPAHFSKLVGFQTLLARCSILFHRTNSNAPSHSQWIKRCS